ncbi:hypothetical protein FHG87_023356 [Trinorchestia longiramus]|nr:hypothetical protein FHG87_023356 [Trinorchestia longiramus]
MAENNRDCKATSMLCVMMKSLHKGPKVVTIHKNLLTTLPACNEEHERLRKEVNRDLHEKIRVMKTESVRKREVGSSFLDMDSLIQAGCFSGDGVHLSQEGETKLSHIIIRWIRATHLFMEDRMD